MDAMNEFAAIDFDALVDLECKKMADSPASPTPSFAALWDGTPQERDLLEVACQSIYDVWVPPANLHAADDGGDDPAPVVGGRVLTPTCLRTVPEAAQLGHPVQAAQPVPMGVQLVQAGQPMAMPAQPMPVQVAHPMPMTVQPVQVTQLMPIPVHPVQDAQPMPMGVQLVQAGQPMAMPAQPFPVQVAHPMPMTVQSAQPTSIHPVRRVHPTQPVQHVHPMPVPVAVDFMTPEEARAHRLMKISAIKAIRWARGNVHLITAPWSPASPDGNGAAPAVEAPPPDGLPQVLANQAQPMDAASPDLENPPPPQVAPALQPPVAIPGTSSVAGANPVAPRRVIEVIDLVTPPRKPEITRGATGSPAAKRARKCLNFH